MECTLEPKRIYSNVSFAYQAISAQKQSKVCSKLHADPNNSMFWAMTEAEGKVGIP